MSSVPKRVVFFNAKGRLLTAQRRISLFCNPCRCRCPLTRKRRRTAALQNAIARTKAPKRRPAGFGVRRFCAALWTVQESEISPSIAGRFACTDRGGTLLSPDGKEEHDAGVVFGRGLHEDEAMPDRHPHARSLQEIGADRREGTRGAGIARGTVHFRRSDEVTDGVADRHEPCARCERFPRRAREGALAEFDKRSDMVRKECRGYPDWQTSESSGRAREMYRQWWRQCKSGFGAAHLNLGFSHLFFAFTFIQSSTPGGLAAANSTINPSIRSNPKVHRPNPLQGGG